MEKLSHHAGFPEIFPDIFRTQSSLREISLFAQYWCTASFIEYWSRTHKTCIWLVHKSGLRYLRAWKPVGGGASHHEIHPSALHDGQSGHLKRAGMGVKPNLLQTSLSPLSLHSSGDPTNTNQQAYCLFFVISLFSKVNYSCRLPPELRDLQTQRQILNRCLLLDPFCQGPLPWWN